jgi:hypothetical protein
MYREKTMGPYRVLPVLLLALAAACTTTWPVDLYEAPGADITARSTYAWTGGQLGGAKDLDPAAASATEQHLREVVVSALARKGYEEVADAKAARMLVSYQVADTKRFVTSKTPKYHAPNPDDVLMTSNPQPPAASELPREHRVTEGSVIIFVADPTTGQIVWRGAISAETRSSSSEQAIHTAADMAAGIMESFPARNAPR